MDERLQKIIAASGLCSRRAAEKLLEEGRVRVDGRPARLGDKADPATAAITVDGRTAVIEGVPRFSGAPVAACDLRAGAAVVIAGLCAAGTTEVEDVHYIERGYEDFVGKLRSLGADIVCITAPDRPHEPAPITATAG